MGVVFLLLFAQLSLTGFAPVGAPEANEQAIQAPPAEEGSPRSGAELFAGSVRFHNGGPPCASCHRAANVPFPNGGSLGPDLTGVAAKYGSAGLTSLLSSLAFPTMMPVFGRRMPTPDEQRDLAAFLIEAGAGSSPAGLTIQLVLPALAGGAAFFGLAAVVGRRRLKGVRRELVRESLAREGRRR